MNIRIAGIKKFSLEAYEGKVATVISMQGCPWRCPFCNNPELVYPKHYGETIDAKKVLAFLRRSKGRVQGVVVTGGEPTYQEDLIPFLRTIKELGFDIKLETNGYHPEKLQQALFGGLVDYVAMDVKAPLENYSPAVGTRVDPTKIQTSIRSIMHSGIDYEFRTTAVPGLHTIPELKAIRKLVSGANRYVIQEFIPGNTIRPEFAQRPPFPRKQLEQLRTFFKDRVGSFELRFAPEPIEAGAALGRN